MENICCMFQDNICLKNIIEHQTQTIGQLIQEKNEIKKQYENFILSMMNTSNIDNSSNIDNTSNII